jgi:hypothetical protein
MLRLDIIPGLRPDDRCTNWRYKMRDKHQDMPRTKEYYEANPPYEGDTVVVLHTWAGNMMKPHVTTIETITPRKRLVVNHNHQGYAGKSFWRTGQNCYAPTGQCWLVPGELYTDIPVPPSVAKRRESDSLQERMREEQPALIEMAKFFGGADRLVRELRLVTEQTGLNGDEAVSLLGREIIFEKIRPRDWLGRKITRDMIRSYERAKYKETN